MRKFWMALGVVGCMGSITFSVHAADFNSRMLKLWLEGLPPARLPVVSKVVCSEAVPRWSVTDRRINLDNAKSMEVPPNRGKIFPFPHGVTFECSLPYPSEVEVSVRPGEAAEETLLILAELKHGGDRTRRMYRDGYYMKTWEKMEAADSGELAGKVIISVVPPKDWRGRSEPGPDGSEGLEFHIISVSLNAKYYHKRYKGPGLPRSTSFIYTLMIGKD